MDPGIFAGLSISIPLYFSDLIDIYCARYILNRKSERVKEGDFIVICPALDPPQNQLPYGADYMVLGNKSSCNGIKYSPLSRFHRFRLVGIEP